MKFKFNVKGVDRSGGGKLVKNGVYKIKVSEAPITQPEGKGVRIELRAKINDKRTNDGEFDGTTLKTFYINLDRDDLMWKVADMSDAFGLGDAGNLDDKTLVGKECRARITSKNDDEWGPQNEIRALLPLDDTDDDEPTEDEEPDEEPDGDEPETEEEEPGLTRADLAGYTRAELKTFIKDAELGTLKDLGITAKTTDEEIATIIGDALDLPTDDEEPEEEPEPDEEPEEEEEPETEEEPEEEEEPEAEDDGLGDLDRAALKKLLVAEEIDFKVFKSTEDDAIRDAIRTARGVGQPLETPDYTKLDLPGLKAECVKRGLSDKGAKKILVERLQKDDEPF